MKARIKKCDALNFCVEVYREVINPKTKEKREEWKEEGYFGHRLEHAIEFAVLRGYAVDGIVTLEEHKKMMKTMLEETQKLFTGRFEVEA